MLVAAAHVRTDHARRYLRQLCRHFEREATAHPEIHLRVDWSDERGVAEFGWGRCVLRAQRGALTVQAEGPDEESLQRVEHLVTDHLDRFSGGDQLTVAWSRPRATTAGPAGSPEGRGAAYLAGIEPYPTGPDETDTAPGGGSSTGRSWPGVVVIGVVAAILLLFVGLHLVFGGGFRGAH
jgi:hypothetical protein